MRVQADIVDGEVLRTREGTRARRVFRVTELTGPGEQRLSLAASAPGVPQVGTAHRHEPGIFVSELRARFAGADPSIALVDVTYAPPDGAAASGAGTGGWLVEIQSDLLTEETVRDVQGRLMGTAYSQRLQLTSGGGIGGAAPTFGSVTSRFTHRVEVQRPTWSLVFSRDLGAFPLAQARAFAGKVNAGTFQREPVDTWLCAVSSAQQPSGAHRVRFTFTFNASGWQPELTHREAGVIPADVRFGNGLNRVQVYARADFNALGLPQV